jgi:hypothetical protein
MSKRIIYLSTFLFSITLLSGCASSDRMLRLSGGIAQEYSVPKQHRLRSASYQLKTQTHSRVKHNFSKESLINLWPFFFRTDAYYSILWPLIDYDPYGMAIRPFYCHEGDDYSILFPLSNWNKADRSWWFLLANGSPEHFGIFPLMHHSFNKNNGYYYYTPLFINSWEYQTCKWHYFNKLKSKNFTEFLLGYYGKDVYVKTNKFQDSLFYRARYLMEKSYSKDNSIWDLVAYHLRDTNIKVPKTKQEQLAFVEKVFNDIKDEEIKIKHGFFPLYHSEYTKDSDKNFELLVALLLYRYQSSSNDYVKKTTHGALLNLLYNYNSRQYDWTQRAKSKSLFAIPALLTFIEKSKYYENSKEYLKAKEILSLANRAYGNNFNKYKSEIEEWFIANTKAKMPATIKDAEILELWVKDYYKNTKFPQKEERKMLLTPLYYGENSSTCNKDIFPLLLTGWEENHAKKSKTFLSIPLLTFKESSPTKSSLVIGTKLVFSNKKETKERFTKKIYPKTEKFVHKNDLFSFDDTFALLGLYFHGQNGFNIVKDNYQAKDVESLRSNIFTLRATQKRINSRQSYLTKTNKRNLNWKTTSKLEELKRLVALEEDRIAQEKLDKEKSSYHKQLTKWIKLSNKLNLNFSSLSLSDKNYETTLKKLFDQCVTTQYWEDYGSGLFYRKELYHNKDYKWNTFLNVASGNKNDNEENIQFLHFLYRHNQKDDQSETIIFPFITKKTNKDYSSYSFLWRLFEYHQNKDKKGGFIFFIPWGNK